MEHEDSNLSLKNQNEQRQSHLEFAVRVRLWTHVTVRTQNALRSGLRGELLFLHAQSKDQENSCET
jgi:hypothetical protein